MYNPVPEDRETFQVVHREAGVLMLVTEQWEAAYNYLAKLERKPVWRGKFYLRGYFNDEGPDGVSARRGEFIDGKYTEHLVHNPALRLAAHELASALQRVAINF